MNDAVTDRNLALEAVRVTEAAAVAAMAHLGGGDERAADEAAVKAMMGSLDTLMVDGTVRMGEGEEGEVEDLYTGQKLGTGGAPKADVAVLALEGKSIIARGGYNALSVIALAEDGGFLSVPNLYMEKIAVGPGLPEDVIDLDAEPAENLKALAKARKVAVSDLVVCMLDRPRHAQIVNKVREAGARIRLILDGDVSGVVATALPGSGVDIFLGSGRATQGVLSAAALRGLGGQMQSRLIVRNEDETARLRKAGIEDTARKYSMLDMASGNVTFAATGVTTGPMLSGVQFTDKGVMATTHSLVVRSKTRTLRYIEGHHHVSKLTGRV
ncbi:MAG: class II fructose-bisphosphatase [Rhodospirillales bacterium]